MQFRLEEPGKRLPEWGKPKVYGLDSEADAHDYTSRHGYTYHIHIIKRGFPTEKAAQEKLKEMGIL